MKKALLAAMAIGALTAGLAGSALADENSWVIRVQPGSGGDWWNPSASGSKALLRTSTTATVMDDSSVKDPVDGTSVPPPMGGRVYSAWYRPSWSLSNTNPSWAALTDAQRPLNTTSNLVKTWDDLIVWATDGYASDSIYMSFITLAPSGSNDFRAPNSIGGKPVYYKLVLTYAPSSYTGPRSWDLSSPSDPISYTNVQQGMYLIHEITLPSLNAIGTNPISGTGPLQAEQTFGYRFSIITPEPGSMVVMASGLVGLVGLVSRRRKA